MFSPEDELDVLDQELGGLRRELHGLDMTPAWRIEDEDAFLAKRVRLVGRLRSLESGRARAYADLLAGAEDLALTTGLEEWLGGRP